MSTVYSSTDHHQERDDQHAEECRNPRCSRPPLFGERYCLDCWALQMERFGRTPKSVFYLRPQ